MVLIIFIPALCNFFKQGEHTDWPVIRAAVSRTVKSHGFAMRLTVWNQISRSQVHVQYPVNKLTY